MANTAELTRTSPIGEWLKTLFDLAFFHPSDEVSSSTMKENLVQSFIWKANHDDFSLKSFLEMMEKFRKDNVSSLVSIKELQSWDAPDGSGGGCVAHAIHVKDTNKETGVSTELQNVMVANVQVIGGKRMLVSVTEVSNAPK